MFLRSLSSSAMRFSVPGLLRTRPMTVLLGSLERCFRNAHCFDAHGLSVALPVSALSCRRLWCCLLFTTYPEAARNAGDEISGGHGGSRTVWCLLYDGVPVETPAEEPCLLKGTVHIYDYSLGTSSLAPESSAESTSYETHTVDVAAISNQ